jgi:hypothetical protein
VRVVVPVFKTHRVDVFVRVVLVTMDVCVGHVLVFVAGVRVIVDLLAVSVLMVVRTIMFMFCRHVLTSFNCGG